MTKITRAPLAILLLLGLTSAASAQTYTIAPTPFGTVLDNSGKIVVAGCVWTYASGTTNPIKTYADTAGTENAQPIVADFAGRFTAYLLAGTNYKFVYENVPCSASAHGSVLRTADPIAGVPGAAATVDVTATAGEAISAGQCVYWSDGSGGKTAGQVYKCDSANPYSSTTPEVGIATAAIASAAAGSVRLAGTVTGLSSLSVGAEYFVGTAGALTSTAPTSRRHVGHADTATSLVLTADPPPPPNVNTALACGRLTLTAAVPITTADVTAATTLYYTPVSGCNQVTLWNGTANQIDTLTETSIAVPATTSQMYDVFAFDNAGAVNIEVLAWTNDTTRATAVSLQNGYLAKAATPARRYIGSFRTTTVSGQTEDSAAKRYVWNYYQRARRPVKRSDPANSWTYTTATIRQANGNTANQIDIVQGFAESPIDLSLALYVSNSSGALNVSAGIGEDSTSTFSANQYGAGYVQILAAFAAVPLTLGPVRLVVVPAIGRHFYSHNEYSQVNATTTWIVNDPLAVSNQRGGLTGWWES